MAGVPPPNQERCDERFEEEDHRPEERRAVPLRTRVRMQSVRVRPVVRVHEAARGSALMPVDARALLAVLSPERARFLRLARTRVGESADAEDIVQRALARASERAAQLGDPARARAWFYRILRHAIADHHRARANEPPREPAERMEELADDSSSEPRGNPCACALHLLNEMRPAYAEVLRRVDVEGEEPNAVAVALGISPGNLHVKLHRARRALQARVKDHCGVASHRPCLDCTCGPKHRCGGGESATAC